MTDRKPSNGTRGDVARTARLAGAPISWGVCEVPGWGPQLPAEEVLAQMRRAGLTATEAGADGFLPAAGDELARVLAEAGLDLVGGFVPVVLHDPAALRATLARVRAQAERFARAGGTVLLSAVVTDEAWSPRVPLSDDAWRRIADGLARLDEVCAERDVDHLLHPHVGTLVETRADVERVLETSAVRLCLDTGHLAIGGVDSVALACDAPRRVGHVHLKDVTEAVAAEVRAGRASLVEATRRGLFVPLGEGDAPVAEVLRALEAGGYDGWYVLEQDTVLADPAGGARATDDVRRSIAFLRRLGSGRGLAAQRAGGR